MTGLCMIGAVDIGGTKITAGIVDDSGKVLSRMQAPTDPDRYDHGIELIARMLRELRSRPEWKSPASASDQLARSIPSTANSVTSTSPGWRGKSPVKDLAEIFKVRVALENDGDAAALAEAGWGAGRNRSRLIYVTVGTGIGGGIIIDGQLYRGVDGAHPEVGHQVIDPTGPQCSCGFRGCWESLAAGPAMVAWIDRHAPPAYLHRPGITAKRICELALDDDAIALQAVEHEAYYLGLGLANLINLFTPDAIVLSGSVMKSAPLF